MIEVEPELKLALHDALRKNGSNLKEWFVEQAELFLGKGQSQLEISFENQNVMPNSGGRQ